MSRGCALWIGLFTAGILWLVAGTIAPAPDGAWTQAYVEEHWGPVDTGSATDANWNSFDVGWDSSNRYYAIADGQNVTLVDRTSQRICSIEWGTIWADGGWIDDSEALPGYEVQIRNQYGLNISFRLDFPTWQITETTYGDCPMSPNDCHPVDPPLVSTYTCTA